MFFLDSYLGYDDLAYFDGGVDRRHWNDKSEAAIRRENRAKELFDAFLEECKTMPSFPVTQEVVPAAVHLTDACWKTFKAYVVAKGCKTKRRVATPAERIASKDTRKSKLYVISVTVPVNPTALLERQKQENLEAERKAKEAKAAAEKRAAAAAKKAELEKILQTKIKEEYAGVVATIKGTKENEEKKAPALKERSTNTAKSDSIHDDGNDKNPSPKKRLKMTTITVPTERLISHAERMHQVRLQEIVNEIHREKMKERTRLLAELDKTMDDKKEAAKAKAKDYRDSVIAAIQGMTSSCE